MDLKRLIHLMAIGGDIGVIDMLSVIAKGAKAEHDTASRKGDRHRFQNHRAAMDWNSKADHLDEDELIV